MKHEGFTPQNTGEITPKNEGNVGSHGNYSTKICDSKISQSTLGLESWRSLIRWWSGDLRNPGKAHKLQCLWQQLQTSTKFSGGSKHMFVIFTTNFLWKMMQFNASKPTKISPAFETHAVWGAAALHQTSFDSVPTTDNPKRLSVTLLIGIHVSYHIQVHLVFHWFYHMVVS